MSTIKRVKLPNNETPYDIGALSSNIVYNGVTPTIGLNEEIENILNQTEKLVSIEWADLVDLRDNDELVPGTYYRIIDYNFVTNKTGVMSGNHQFDIVVLAISENMLSENAYAVRPANDAYFTRQIIVGGVEWLYSLYVDDYGDNYDTEPMDHANDLHCDDIFVDYGFEEHPSSGDEVPVLYKTNYPEYDLDDPDYDDRYFYEGTYNLDGDDYDMWSKWEIDDNSGDLTFANQYALTAVIIEDGDFLYDPTPVIRDVAVNMNAWELKYCLDNDTSLFNWASSNGKGVIYYMKDEFGNEAPYDFKNAIFQRYKIQSVVNTSLISLRNNVFGQTDYYNITCDTSAANSKYYYTFQNSNYDSANDGSLFGNNTYNVIKPYIDHEYDRRDLNNIVLLDCNSVVVENDAHDCTIVSGLNSTLKAGCNYILTRGISNSEIGASSRYITLINVSDSTMGTFCQYLTGSSPSTMRMGSSNSYINLGNNNVNLSTEPGCSQIDFGNYCSGIRIAQHCNSLAFGNYCVDISIGAKCNTITIGNYFRFSTIEPDCNNITLNTSGGSTSNYVQHVKICMGVKNMLKQPTRNQAYEQIYYKAGRIETSV